MATNTAPVSNIPISIDYTSRDYYALRTELITRLQTRVPEWQGSDPADFGLALVEAFAYMGDIINYYIDRAANESYLITATQRSSVLNIAKSYGYEPAGYATAEVTLTFTNASTTEFVDLPEGTQVYGNVVINDVLTQIIFTTVQDVNIAPEDTATVLANHGEQVAYRTENLSQGAGDISGELLGYSFGTASQVFVLSENQVVDSTVTVFVRNGDVYQEWRKVDSLSSYGPTDAVYTTDIDANNYVGVIFGDGISGAIPPLHEPIKVQYLVGGGSIGNIAAGVIDTLYTVPELDASEVTALSTTISVTNAEAGYGGANPESSDSIRKNAPRALSSLTRAVSVQDFANLTLRVAGVSKASAKATSPASVTVYFSVLAANSQEQYPSYDGDPALGGVVTTQWNTIKSRIQESLADKLLIGTTVTLSPPTYIPIVTTIEYTVLPQYTATNVSSSITAALLDSFSFNSTDFGTIITPEDVEYILRRVPGVATVSVTQLYRDGATAARNVLIGKENELFVFTEAETTATERSSVATLSALTASSGTLSPSLTANHYNYTLVSCATNTTTFTPTVTAAGSTVTVNGVSAATAAATPASTISTVTIVVTAPDKYTQKTYTITVDRT
jgi:hypothetical protein